MWLKAQEVNKEDHKADHLAKSASLENILHIENNTCLSFLVRHQLNIFFFLLS